MSFSQISAGDTSLTAQQREGRSPLVSVIIPCYNSARYLARPLRVFWRKRTLGSKSSWLTTVPPMEPPNRTGLSRNYVYQYNRGISAARNTGFLHSRASMSCFSITTIACYRGASKPG